MRLDARDRPSLATDAVACKGERRRASEAVGPEIWNWSLQVLGASPGGTGTMAVFQEPPAGEARDEVWDSITCCQPWPCTQVG